ncbi:MAG TPA: cysteine desulfurase [Myxococcales bacterium]|nr:cysteine desulfurase [Myxococcales bacterium]HIL80245.1 cysteine desulfurase [Myxococcales bacterium]
MRIYLDHNATTPLRPEVVEAMSRALRDQFGNPSSVYAEGASARARIEVARGQVASLVGVEAGNIRFTGGATESNNTVLFGCLASGDHVVTTEVEHPSVVAPLAVLEEQGVSVSRIKPDQDGCVDAAEMADAINDQTKLLTMIWANNETGSIQPVQAVAEACRDRGVLMHVDATQVIGKSSVDLAQTPIDFLSSSAHKLGGPKGVGALVSCGDTVVPAFLHGGGQEKGLRGGTENVASIVGYGVACELSAAEGPERMEHSGKLRERLWHGIQAQVESVRWNGGPEKTLCNTLNIEFKGVAGEVLLQALDLEGVAASAGAACHSGSIEPSAVLLAMGRSADEARASLRFSIGWGVDEEQIDRAIELLGELVPRVRQAEAP